MAGSDHSPGFTLPETILGSSRPGDVVSVCRHSLRRSVHSQPPSSHTVGAIVKPPSPIGASRHIRVFPEGTPALFSEEVLEHAGFPVVRDLHHNRRSLEDWGVGGTAGDLPDPWLPQLARILFGLPAPSKELERPLEQATGPYAGLVVFVALIVLGPPSSPSTIRTGGALPTARTFIGRPRRALAEAPVPSLQPLQTAC